MVCLKCPQDLLHARQAERDSQCAAEAMLQELRNECADGREVVTFSLKPWHDESSQTTLMVTLEHPNKPPPSLQNEQVVTTYLVGCWGADCLSAIHLADAEF